MKVSATSISTATPVAGSILPLVIVNASVVISAPVPALVSCSTVGLLVVSFWSRSKQATLKVSVTSIPNSVYSFIKEEVYP